MSDEQRRRRYFPVLNHCRHLTYISKRGVRRVGQSKCNDSMSTSVIHENVLVIVKRSEAEQ
ncbi:hypothetical protein M404DRAFT_1004052 [Pisolithus tinctorius Marx 270]|uniref:Uncharacterized protein n=1 Tax=Pisolithus tinctorius Marx 270 TaxID=870435 RepID=A0A0C3IT86_PISTI|nr:hypothetical protein M404DRAFT_1004052 [Pisolithus tinctorius Marx 270]